MRETSTPAGVALLERERELRELRAAVERAAAGESALVMIEGAAGIGKSALLGEVSRMSSEAGLLVLSARGNSIESALAWSVVRRLLVGAVAEADEGERLELLAGAAGLARRVLGLADGPGEQVELSGALHGLYWLTMNLAERRPVLLCVDDVHWVDAQSVSYLNYMANRLGDAPVLIVLAVRAGEPGAAPEGVQALRSQAGIALRLGALTEDATSTLIRQLIGDRATAQVCAGIYRAARGNPFLVRELCRELDGADQPVPAQRLGTTVPEPVARSVSARLARLPPLAAATVEAVAVLGPTATPSRVARLASAGLDDVVELVGPLLEAELLNERGHALEFAHPLVREAVYAGMPAARRAAGHARAARLLVKDGAAADEVAEHLLRAPPAGEEWRVDALQAAAHAVQTAGAPEAAARYLERALAEPPPGDRRLGVLLELGGSLLQHDPAAAISRLREAHRLARSPVQATEVALPLAQAHAALGDYGAGVEVLTQSMSGLGREHEELRRRADSARLTFARWNYDSQGLRRELLASLRARAVAGDDLDLIERANLAQELAALGEDREQAVEHATAVLERVGSSRGPEAIGLMLVASVLVLADRSEPAAAALNQALARAQARGSRVEASVALTMSSYCSLRQGKLVEAIEYAQAVLELTPGIWSTGTIAWLIEALAERGEAEAMEQVLASNGLADPPAVGTPGQPMNYQKAVLYHHRGRARALLSDHEAALADFRAVAELAEAWGVGNPAVLDWRSRAAGCLVALGRSEEAAALVHQELADARRWGAPTPIGTALRVAGQCEPGPEGLALLREAVEVLEGSPARLDRAHALVALGIRLRRERQNLKAREVLREGLDLAHQCGATLLINRARDELVAAGAKPRRDALSGRAALTGREVRVADLAVLGHTNRQIAQALYLSPRTVEHHLRSVYRKLGITSREQLPAAMAADPVNQVRG